MVWLPQNEKQTYRLNSRTRMCPSDLTIVMTMTLNFPGQMWNLIYPSQKWSDCHETKWTYCLYSRPYMWPWDLTLAMTLILNFQGQVWNLPHLNQNWSDCHKMKNEHTDWNLGIKCNHWGWPWPWPWPWIFKVKFWNSHISGIWGPIYIEQKGGSFMTMTVTFWWPWGVRIYPIVTGDFRCQRTADSV